jgi:hypothetical protein
MCFLLVSIINSSISKLNESDNDISVCAKNKLFSFEKSI